MFVTSVPDAARKVKTTMYMTSQFESLAPLPATTALDQVRSLLTTLTRDTELFQDRVLPLLEQSPVREPITVVPLTDTAMPVSVALFAWAPGAATEIHDHSSWGAFGTVIGSLTEERYARLDDGTQLNVAHLRKAWQRVWNRAHGISLLLPYAGGIHRVSNRSTELAISLHCYGPSGAIDGRDYDPMRDYVCDRPHEQPKAAA